MACPFLGGRTFRNLKADAGTQENSVAAEDDDDEKMQKTRTDSISSQFGSRDGANKAAIFSDQISYSGYLQLDRLLDCQVMRSTNGSQIVPDEHLFIITHQTYELWFKQIIFDIDQVRALLHNKIVDETKTLQIVSLLERTAKILKLLVDQILILETMSPLDFVEFRRFLTSASGFQSLQFRLMENKLGVVARNRVSYNYQHYKEVFSENENECRLVEKSELEPSLFVLIDRWLARTPGIYEEEFEEDIEENIEENVGAEAEASDGRTSLSISDNVQKDNNQKENVQKENVQKDNAQKQNAQKENVQKDNVEKDNIQFCLSFDDNANSPGPNNVSGKQRKTFWDRYLEAVSLYLLVMLAEANEPNQSKEERNLRWDEYVKIKRSFNSITNECDYNTFVEKGERRLSHNAMKGALMIYFYRDMPRFSQPYQILFYLMDIDSLLQKWRYNHLMLVQRMLGSKMGSGGSSGYMYLRSTVSDRYKVFLDLFNLSTWLIPRNYIPKLSPKMMKTLSGT